MKIVVADDLPASALDLLRAEAGWVVDARPGRTPAALAADLADADALLVRSATKADAQLIAAATRLRIVPRGGTGAGNRAGAAARAPGLGACNAARANSHSATARAPGLWPAV